MKYRVNVQRTDYTLGEIVVEAPDEEEAHEAALQAAMEGDADVSWEEQPERSDYDTLDAVRVRKGK